MQPNHSGMRSLIIYVVSGSSGKAINIEVDVQTVAADTKEKGTFVPMSYCLQAFIAHILIHCSAIVGGGFSELDVPV